MPWINPPRLHHNAEDTLPYHHGEPGLVWLSDHDGSVWESTWTQEGDHLAVRWSRCHADRATSLLIKFNPEGYQTALTKVFDELRES